MARHAAQDEQIRQHVDHVDGLELPGDPDRQALVGELVDDVEHADTSVRRGCGPRRSRRTRRGCGARAAAGCRIRPPARAGRAWVASGGTFSPSRRQIRSTRLSLTIQPAARSSAADPAIAVAAVLAGQRDDVGGQPLFVVSAPRHLALRRAMLPEHRGRPGARTRVNSTS